MLPQLCSSEALSNKAHVCLKSSRRNWNIREHSVYISNELPTRRLALKLKKHEARLLKRRQRGEKNSKNAQCARPQCRYLLVLAFIDEECEYNSYQAFW